MAKASLDDAWHTICITNFSFPISSVETALWYYVSHLEKQMHNSYFHWNIKTTYNMIYNAQSQRIGANVDKYQKIKLKEIHQTP